MREIWELLESALSELKEKLSKLQDKYLLLYFVLYSGIKTKETAREFLDSYSKIMSKELTLTTLETINSKNLSHTDKLKLMEHNGFNIIDLQDKIIGISR